MQYSPTAGTGPGAHVVARSRPWWVAAQQLAAHARLLHLVPSSGPRGSRLLIDPVDTIAPLAAEDWPRAVSRAAWMRGFAAALAATAPAAEPVSPAGAAVALLPFQLEPLIAFQRGLAARILVADAVGLGKTIQAALVIRELVTRQPTARVLVIAPAGLRDQWCAELSTRAGLEPEPIDADRLAALAGGLPPGTSPWPLVPLAVVSLDLVKQPDIVHGLERAIWDLCVIDEAHLLTPGTVRAHAARTIAERSLRLLLLTATPHDGNEEHYAALCELGRLWEREPLAIFSRSRSVDLPGRSPAAPRIVRLAVRPSRAEAHLHGLLERYITRVWTSPQADRTAARLAMSVLAKRAASGPWALARSLERRLQMREAAIPEDAAAQRPLFEPDGGVDDALAAPVLGAPGLPPAQERLWLRLLIDAAGAAVPHDRKVAALRRLLRRTAEPVLVFTEYRDTLQRCADVLRRDRRMAVLHGGLTAEARRQAAAAFLDGSATLLVATDAASLGLNLHTRCRLVVHLELPWNPLRLEQRVGRVDRLGQPRRVHAIELVSRSTIEARIATRLDQRRARITAARATGAVPETDADETALLGQALELSADRCVEADAEASARTGPTPPDLAAYARTLARALDARRGWLARAARRTGRPPVCRLSGRARQRLGLSRGVLAAFLRRDADATGERERTLTIVCWSGAPPAWPPRRHRVAWTPLLDALRQRALAAPSSADIMDADAIVARRARVIARRAASMRRAEQLALFPDRVARAAAAAAPVPFEAAGDGAVAGPARVGSVELALLLVLE